MQTSWVSYVLVIHNAVINNTYLKHNITRTETILEHTGARQHAPFTENIYSHHKTIQLETVIKLNTHNAFV